MTEHELNYRTWMEQSWGEVVDETSKDTHFTFFQWPWLVPQLWCLLLNLLCCQNQDWFMSCSSKKTPALFFHCCSHCWLTAQAAQRLESAKSVQFNKAGMPRTKITYWSRCNGLIRTQLKAKQQRHSKGEIDQKKRLYCIVRPLIWLMTDGHSSDWTIMYAIVPQHHDKARGIAGECPTVFLWYCT